MAHPVVGVEACMFARLLASLTGVGNGALSCWYPLVFAATRRLQLASPVEEQREGDGEERHWWHARPIQREEGRKGPERQEES